MRHGKVFSTSFTNDLHADSLKELDGFLRGEGFEDVFNKMTRTSFEIGGSHFLVGDIAPRPARHEDLCAEGEAPIQKKNVERHAAGPGGSSRPNRGHEPCRTRSNDGNANGTLFHGGNRVRIQSRQVSLPWVRPSRNIRGRGRRFSFF